MSTPIPAKTRKPGPIASGKKLTTRLVVMIEPHLVEKLDVALLRTGQTRSDFIRKAIVNRLLDEGIMGTGKASSKASRPEIRPVGGQDGEKGSGGRKKRESPVQAAHIDKGDRSHLGVVGWDMQGKPIYRK